MTGTAIIIGGGIGGLAAGIALDRAGWTVEVYERAPALREVGAGLTLWANALRALECLGLDAAVRALAMPEMRGGIFGADGERLLDTNTAAVRARWGELMATVHRAELHALLLDTLGRERLHAGATCVGVSQDAAGATARFADGTEAHGDVVIGADGLWSMVRAALHGDAPPRYSGYTAWRGVTTFDPARLTPGESWGRGARFGQVPLTGGRVYWYATADAPAGARAPDGEKAELLRRFGAWHSPIPALVAATPDDAILRHDIVDRPPLARWGQGRVTLLGDAAHPMTPNLGQGACQALEDAVVLGRVLAGATNVPAALRAYERRRAPRANGFVTTSRTVGRIGQWRHPAAVAARRLLVRHVLPHTQGRQIAHVLDHGL